MTFTQHYDYCDRQITIAPSSSPTTGHGRPWLQHSWDCSADVIMRFYSRHTIRGLLLYLMIVIIICRRLYSQIRSLFKGPRDNSAHTRRETLKSVGSVGQSKGRIGTERSSTVVAVPAHWRTTRNCLKVTTPVWGGPTDRAADHAERERERVEQSLPARRITNRNRTLVVRSGIAINLRYVNDVH